MNRLWLLFIVGLSLISGMLALWPTPSAAIESTQRVVDFAGRTVAVPAKPPMRIISLSPSNTEILYAVGAGDRIIAVTEHSDYPPAALTKPRIGGFQNPDIEQIVALKPDLVLAGSLHIRTVQVLAAAKVPVVVVEPTTMQDVLTALSFVGQLTGDQQTASAARASLERRLTTIRELVAAKPRPRVFFEVWDQPFMTIGGNSYLSDIAREAGGDNVAAAKPADYMAADFEYLYSLDPDLYITVNHTGLGRELAMSSHSWLQNLRAIKQGQVHYVADDILSRPGPRSFDGLEALARILHPEIMQSWRTE